jgi:corrinoid protein of di/trimethylamine methyltransferase
VSTKKEILSKLAEAVIVGDEKKSKKLAGEALKRNVDPYEAIMGGCAEGMKVVSDKYDKLEYYVPDVLISARAMESAVAVLYPHIKVESTKVAAKVILGVVDGDIHDIGKNLVKILMNAAGFNVIDLGKNVSASTFIEAIKEHEPQIVGMSTLMSPTMITMREIIAEFGKQGVRDKVKVIVGGAPITAAYAEEIGADGYEKDAPKAVKLVEKLLKT